MRHRRPHEDTAEIQSRFYYPKDDDINVWMFAMIGIGCVFIIFVAVSLYIMWKSNDEDGRYLFVQQDAQQKVL
ncbi:hypothetical protein R5R35_008898 [Gryllus longicercus]|uniref:Uncharacterized protein n=1 Tax=Gryllus longicercus TaxID=2509291 RepID=A0AAN9VF64_9ORTH